ncbi:hypothetical protein PAPYR_13143 [Paratrimastix pyriformis]|uniref:Uncharacterized protein n=1 Tax=Paratrimastix pyriformis TaxID=342808 RepID=A0ABQ8U2A8_9EUKA|nr:hypothetical protein PAPYR_13143 [Paratrimastix pyriformis]
MSPETPSPKAFRRSAPASGPEFSGGLRCSLLSTRPPAASPSPPAACPPAPAPPGDPAMEAPPVYGDLEGASRLGTQILLGAAAATPPVPDSPSVSSIVAQSPPPPPTTRNLRPTKQPAMRASPLGLGMSPRSEPLGDPDQGHDQGPSGYVTPGESRNSGGSTELRMVEPSLAVMPVLLRDGGLL